MSRAMVERFFGAQLPGAIAAHRDLFSKTKGTLTIILEGASAWTVKFGDPDATDALIEDLDPEADCIGVWTVASFTALMEGEKDRAKIEPIAIEGDERLLSRLGSLMVPAKKGGVGARIAACSA